jgi:uridine kinase
VNPDRLGAVADLARLVGAVERPHPVRVAVDGVEGAGKTVLADELGRLLRTRGRVCLRASLAGFRRPRPARGARAQPSADDYYRHTFDLGALRRELLDPLGPGGSLHYRTRILDPVSGEPVEQPRLEAAREAIVVVSGPFLLRQELRDRWDVAVWVQVDFDVARARGAERDRGSFGPEVDELYRNTYHAAQQHYLEEERPADHAEVVFHNDDVDHPVVVVNESRGR